MIRQDRLPEGLQFLEEAGRDVFQADGILKINRYETVNSGEIREDSSINV